MTTYRLLRNNQESGPFSQEQLISMGLKAYDLVWVEGKSAAWRYPSEVSELAAYAPAVEEQPFDRFYNRPKPPAAKPATKPRFRIKADWRKVEDSANTPQLPTEHKVPSPVYAEKAAPQPAPVAAPTQVTAATTATDEKTTPHTKYSESLDTIKERYSQTVLKRGRFTGQGNIARYVLLVGLFPALAAGIWIGSSWNNRNKLETVQTETPAPASQQEAVPVQATPAITETPAEQEPVPEEATVQMQTIQHTESQPLSPQFNTGKTAEMVKKGMPVAKQPGVKILPPTTDQVKNKYVRQIANTTTGSAPVTSTVLTRPVSAAPRQTAPVTVTPAPSQAYEPATSSGKNKINDYVAVKDEYEQVDENNRQMKLHVHNKSNIPVDLVVLDLQYYDANGRFKKGETLYLNNLSAHDEMTLNAPAAKNNQRIDYKVSLLSIEKKGIYLIAE